jgi:hypothetical protein
VQEGRAEINRFENLRDDFARTKGTSTSSALYGQLHYFQVRRQNEDARRRTLDELNRAWRDKRFEDLPRFFHENVVMKGASFEELVRGPEALM